MEILDLKNTIIKKKKKPSVNGLNSKMEGTEERHPVSELEDRIVEITQSEKQKID